MGNRGHHGVRTRPREAHAEIDGPLGVTRGADGKFNAFKLDKTLTRELARGVGTVKTSLFEAGQQAGLPIGVLSELIRAFSFDVDFQREVQPGDSFDVVFERFRDEDGKPVKDGAVVFAALTLSGKTQRLWRHVGRDGFADFYNDKGESVRKALLKTPIDGAKLTSRFGARAHPILGYTAKHKGADFGAATGTPIQAAGDGVVETAGEQGGYGNYVRLRHNAEFATAYGHMSRIAVKPGTRVRQGQVIGYVGMTGLATGPHVHYEYRVNGVHKNPATVTMPRTELPTQYRAEFEQQAGVALARLAVVARPLSDAPTYASN
jgi:murein DD-endopeptidase MepM/ murein hydrolase activator NlpD